MYVYYFVQYSALCHFHGSVCKLLKRQDMTELASHHPRIVQGRFRWADKTRDLPECKLIASTDILFYSQGPNLVRELHFFGESHTIKHNNLQGLL